MYYLAVTPFRSKRDIEKQKLSTPLRLAAVIKIEHKMKSALETSSSSTASEMVDLEHQRKMSVFGRDKNVQVDWKDLTGSPFNYSHRYPDVIFTNILDDLNYKQISTEDYLTKKQIQ